MTWGVGVLTWNDPATCTRTLAALVAGLTRTSTDHLVVLDHGSDRPFTTTLPGVEVVRVPTNQGAGAGVTALVRALLARDVDAVLCLEDDWTLEHPLALTDLAPLVADPEVGQVRLAQRPPKAPQKYYTYGLEGPDAARAAQAATSPLFPYPAGHYQRLRSLWSHNPFACRRDVAERFLLTGQDELTMARPYYAAGLTTLSTTPGHFRHLGTIRDRRGRPGWRK